MRTPRRSEADALDTFLVVMALTGLLVVGLEASRRRTESTLRSSEERFRAMIENATDLVTVLGRDGTIMYESPSVERILGWPPGALGGQNVLDWIHPSDRAATVAALDVLRAGGEASVILRFRQPVWAHPAELATAAGTPKGMVAGQVSDLEGEGKTPDPVLLETIHRAKTGALLRASLRIGAIYAGATEEQLGSLSNYGEHVGLAFQIVDDILDVVGDGARLGKPAGTDLKEGNVTLPAIYALNDGLQVDKVELARILRAPRKEKVRGDRPR